jgi:cytochrome c-type biogenesis protein CcmH
VIFELLLAGMAFVVLMALMVPLLRPSGPVMGRGQYDKAVYRDQLQELDRDIARGLITETDAGSARLEIQRRLLAADAAPDAVPSRRGGGRNSVVALLVAVFVGGGAVTLYMRMGQPELPDMPFASRSAATQMAADGQQDPQHLDMVKAVDELGRKLKADPSNLDGWLLYARASGSLRRWDQAADAYRHAITLGAKGADVQAGLGEILTIQAEGVVTPAAQTAFEAALKADPKNDVAEYYMALAAGQAGEPKQAIQRFQTLLSEIPEDSPMRQEIGQRITEAAKVAGVPAPELARGTPPAPEPPASETAGGPDAADAAKIAGLPPDQQKEMIGQMVSRLAAQMQANPGDADGWMRLGRAYAVLGQMDKAGDAYQHAVALKPGDNAVRLAAVDGMLGQLKPSDPLPQEAVTMLKQVQQTEPDQPEVLWYLGVVAVRDAHPEQAKEYWSKLLGRLPADGDDARMVKAAMDQLKGG